MLQHWQEQLHTAGEVYLRIKVRPQAAATAVKSVLADETIKIDVAAVPQRNKANEELVRFLAHEFGVAKENVSIISGKAESLKLIKVTV